MATITTLSSELIEKRKIDTINAQSLRKTVSFRDINLIDDKTIEYSGNRISITDGCFKSLLKLIGMSNQFAKNFEALFNPEAKAAFINRIKDAMASNAGNLNQVTLVVSPSSRTVISITKKPTDLISNSQFLHVAENIIDRQGFDVTNWSVDPNSGIININAFNPKAKFEVKGLSDEVFTGGISFRNSPVQGFQVIPYVNRMWCANGMSTPLAEEAYTLHSLDSSVMDDFFEQLNQLRKTNYAPSLFADRVRKAVETPASIHEMNTAWKMLNKHVGDQANNWIPLEGNLNRYANIGYENMNSDQMRNAKSNQSIWSIVNGITHFATHAPDLVSEQIESSDQTQLMVQAGSIFGKKRFDHENDIPNPFSGSLNDTVQIGSMLS
jgi:hypothetical protein